MPKRTTDTIFDALALLAASFPVYLIAAWSGFQDYLSTATPEQQGWLIVTFPLFLIPPVTPWLVAALPVCAALSLPHGPARVAGLAAALILALWVGDRFTLTLQPGFPALSTIGSVSPAVFVGGIWLAMLGMAAYLHRTRRSH